jgi:hypothetical protein
MEGQECTPKAKNGTGKREAIKAKPCGEARSHSESLEKHLVHSVNHGISVWYPHVYEGLWLWGTHHEKGLER